jgi:hypothetical protein
MTTGYAQELADLFTIGGGDRESSAALVVEIAAGRLRLPPCFDLRNGTAEQTARAHELARLLVAN